MSDFTSSLIAEYSEPTRYSDLYFLKKKTLPEDVRNYFIRKAKGYENVSYAYAGKDYTNIAKTSQIDINANSDENTYCLLLQTDQAFVEAINNLILTAAEKGEIYIPEWTSQPLLVDGIYDFNTNHGLTNHDLFQDIKREPYKTYIDLLRREKNPSVIQGIEVKTDNKEKQPTGMHKADLVLLHILGTTTTVVYAPTVPYNERTDTTYVKIGSLTDFGEWYNIRVDAALNITKW